MSEVKRRTFTPEFKSKIVMLKQKNMPMIKQEKTGDISPV